MLVARLGLEHFDLADLGEAGVVGDHLGAIGALGRLAAAGDALADPAEEVLAGLDGRGHRGLGRILDRAALLRGHGAAGGQGQEQSQCGDPCVHSSILWWCGRQPD